MSEAWINKIVGSGVEFVGDVFYNVGCSILSSSTSGDVFQKCMERSRKNGFFNYVSEHYKRLSGQFVADISLVRSWDGSKYDPKPPNVKRFQKGNKQLSFVAALHSNKLNCETFRKIRNEFFAFKPEIVIVEGLETSKGVSPEWNDNDRRLDSKKWPCGEPCYTIALAFQNH
ncbi:MAG: hypothetical protein HYU98_04630, partial [Deltaproteobacteria bacterium]|nr:hypothetical protein [Deltaproteobacteria bacterium]